MANEVAVNVLGTIGTVLWCIQLIPQIVRNYRVKDCTGLPSLMMFLWALSGVPFSIYFFGIDGPIPLRVQPQLFTAFSIISWAQVLYYPPISMNYKRFSLYMGVFIVCAIGAEVTLILFLRPLYRKGITWPMLVVGIIASVLLCIGLVPPYFEIAKRKGRVVGINFFFLGMDAAGALFSLLSIIAGTIDITSLVLYAIVLVMEIGIFACWFVWYFTGGRTILREEKEARRLEKREKVDAEINPLRLELEVPEMSEMAQMLQEFGTKKVRARSLSRSVDGTESGCSV